MGSSISFQQPTARPISLLVFSTPPKSKTQALREGLGDVRDMLFDVSGSHPATLSTSIGVVAAGVVVSEALFFEPVWSTDVGLSVADSGLVLL